MLKSSADPDSSGNIPEMPATIEKMPEVACKEYDPSQFSEARVASEVLQEENEQLKKKVCCAVDFSEVCCVWYGREDYMTFRRWTFRPLI